MDHFLIQQGQEPRGYTDDYNNKFIQAKENTIVIFDSSIEHRGTKSTDQDFRYLINFNYF